MHDEIKIDKTKGSSYKVVCVQCDNKTNHEVISSADWSWGNEDIQGSTSYQIIKCLGCDSISFRTEAGNSEDYDYDDYSQNIIYHTQVEIYPGRIMGRTPLKNIYILPVNIRGVYSETHTALCSKSRLLASIGIRVLLEIVCKEEKAKGRTLEKKIEDLVTKEVLTKSNAEILHKTRFLGNKAAHGMRVPNESELDVSFDIIENLLKTLYIIPAKTKHL